MKVAVFPRVRLWSLHPTLLDGKGLGALWREGLLAVKVVTGRIVGYRHHPQLTRWYTEQAALMEYMHVVCDEAHRRRYKYDRSLLPPRPYMRPARIPVTRGQLEYEYLHLQRKLDARAPEHPRLRLNAHPAFRVLLRSDVEPWERPQ